MCISWETNNNTCRVRVKHGPIDSICGHKLGRTKFGTAKTSCHPPKLGSCGDSRVISRSVKWSHCNWGLFNWDFGDTSCELHNPNLSSEADSPSQRPNNSSNNDHFKEISIISSLLEVKSQTAVDVCPPCLTLSRPSRPCSGSKPIYVCTYVHTYVCMYVRMYVRMYVYYL